MYQNQDIKEGMTVRSEDGHKLGKVYAVDDREFHIEKGLFFPKDYSVRYGEISAIRDGEIILAHGKDSLRSFSDSMLDSEVLAYREQESAPREALGIPPLRRTEDLQGVWMNKGMRSDDLGNQEIGPYNTEGARASPISTEEDRAERLNGLGMPPPPPVPARPVMRASFEEPLRGQDVEEELTQEPRRGDRREDLDENGRRKLDLSGEDELLKRGF